MIKFENTRTYGWDGAIRGMRNPKNSWDKSDSHWCYSKECVGCKYEEDPLCTREQYVIGVNDADLMNRLVLSGSEHRKFMRMIHVQVDIAAPLYWWKEFDTYKVGTTANSCSTMHKLADRDLTMEDFSTEHLYAENLLILENIITRLNFFRDLHVRGKDKNDWWQMIQLLPTSYNQRRTVDLNYETIYNMVCQRKYHKLDEWKHGFMEWVDTLPHSYMLLA